MANNFEDALSEFYNHAEKMVNLDEKQRSEVTSAGAEAFSNALKEVTPKSAVSYATGPKKSGKGAKHRQHLVDTITYVPGKNADGLENGDTAVGFQYKDDDFLVHIINDGKKKMSTKEMKNLHFLERAEANARDEMGKAMSRKIAEVTKHGT